MIRPLALFIGLRYTRAKRRNHFISFISLASMLGIALGIAVLITVLSVMNGFDYQIRTKFFSIAPEVTIVTTQDISQTWPHLQQQITQQKRVQNAAPYASGKAMLAHGGQIAGLELQGIIPEQEKKVSSIYRDIIQGNLASLRSGSFNIVIGEAVANSLGLNLGDKVTVITPDANITLAGVFPRYKVFTVSGIFKTNSGFGFDQAVAFIDFSDAGKLFQGDQRSSGLHVKMRDLYQAPALSEELSHILPAGYGVTNWTEQYGAFFKALAMEKVMLFIILLLIVAVAAFNLVSTLVMLVQDKRADIAILRTLGASPRTIMATFIIQGAIVGLIGTLLGLVGGLLLAYNATAIANFIQNVFHVQLISSSVYFVDYLPSKIQASDVLYVCLIGFAMSVLATIYPAIVAFRTQPAEALRYE
jgi:lipoprotein-releasing system permease protein